MVTLNQSDSEAVIRADRNTTFSSNEAYGHDFPYPPIPCGLTNPNITNLLVTIELLNITTIPVCAGIAIFGNVYVNCDLAQISCSVDQEVLTIGCGAFGGGQTTT